LEKLRDDLVSEMQFEVSPQKAQFALTGLTLIGENKSETAC